MARVCLGVGRHANVNRLDCVLQRTGTTVVEGIVPTSVCGTKPARRRGGSSSTMYLVGTPLPSLIYECDLYVYNLQERSTKLWVVNPYPGAFGSLSPSSLSLLPSSIPPTSSTMCVLHTSTPEAASHLLSCRIIRASTAYPSLSPPSAPVHTHAVASVIRTCRAQRIPDSCPTTAVVFFLLSFQAIGAPQLQQQQQQQARFVGDRIQPARASH